jgi:PIN domain nuclease of toxin-antitoxin system
LRADRLLLDTHAYLWWRRNDPLLSEAGRRAIADAPFVFVSVASAWEAAIKVSVGKLRLDEPIREGIDLSAFQELPITLAHTEIVARLPLHHRDPFDRMLVAQCIGERLVLVTRDRHFEAYGVDVIWT